MLCRIKSATSSVSFLPHKLSPVAPPQAYFAYHHYQLEMIGKSFFICAFCSFLVLTFATFFVMMGAEDSGGQNPDSTSPRSSNRSSSPVSESRAEDGNPETAQRNDEQ